METFIEVNRKRQGLDGKQISQETRYYVSNANPASGAEPAELLDAIRQHWLVEAMHHYRDLTLAKDGLRTEIQGVSRLMSCLWTLTINLLKRMNPKNKAAQIDEFAENFNILIQFRACLDF